MRREAALVREMAAYRFAPLKFARAHTHTHTNHEIIYEGKSLNNMNVILKCKEKYAQ